MNHRTQTPVLCSCIYIQIYYHEVTKQPLPTLYLKGIQAEISASVSTIMRSPRKPLHTLTQQGFRPSSDTEQEGFSVSLREVFTQEVLGSGDRGRDPTQNR